MLDVNAIEKRWQQYWEKNKIYRFDPKSKKKIFSIDTPPPYASAGHLHVGHALSYTQFEIIARVMRILGREVYFPPGFDDNGLPTEKYVEEKLKIDKSKIDRAKFRKLCLEESKKIEKLYAEKVFKRLGHSYDWDLLYTTISPEAQKIAQIVFLRLIKSKHCYRKEEPVIWCPHHETALAQAEVEDLKRKTKLNYVSFDIENKTKNKKDKTKNKIKIATSRPELLSSCVAIFVNPQDKRYKHLIGKKAIVPLFNYKVPIKQDEKVDPEFGTGIVMICTFGDTGDIELWKKYNLPLKISINKKGKLNNNAGKYQGLTLKEAKEKILEDLKKEKRLIKQEEIEQTVGSCWRCSAPIEFIVTKQWFIKTLSFKKQLIAQGRKIKWYPGFYRARYEDWVRNLGWDWCISRQRYYGTPIPVWYCDKCNQVILPTEKELPLDPIEHEKICPKCKKKAVPDTDVFDTWMTSSNTPEIASQWLKNPQLYKKISPMSIRPQSHDIIRTWAFYTILKSYLLFKKIPWKEVTINTFVLDPKGRGMSKSRGNAIWADDLIEKYGVDAFRYWVGSASLGSDIPFKEQELVAGKKFLTKIWNASRFVFMHLKNYKLRKPKKLEAIDSWILHRLSETLKNVKTFYEKYNIAEARKKAEIFFWHDFADNYLEIIKDRIYNGTPRGKESAKYTLYICLLSILKMMAPITPFITEEIYQEYFKKSEKDKSIHISTWPKIDIKINKKIEKSGNLFIKILAKVRKEKAKAQKSLKAEIILTIDKKTQKELKPFINDLIAVTKAKEIKTGKFSIKFL